MSYDPTTDFLGLLRLVGSSVRSERMPGLDWATSALYRMGMFALSVGQTAPVASQSTTVWLKPAIPSWSAEGVVFLWNPTAGEYQQATPTLWRNLLSPSGYSFQSLPDDINIIDSGVTLAAVQRDAPVATAITLPSLAEQFNTQRDLNIIDFSTNIAGVHTITLTPAGDSTIMQRANWTLLSTTDSLAGVRLIPCFDLNSWAIAP